MTSLDPVIVPRGEMMRRDAQVRQAPLERKTLMARSNANANATATPTHSTPHESA